MTVAVSHPLDNTPSCATIVAMTAEPLREVRDHLSDYVDRAASQHERVVVTRNGRPVAVLIGYEDLEALEETLDILSDPDARADLAAADEAIVAGDVVHGADAVRKLRASP
jgi:antitoxin YefM